VIVALRIGGAAGVDRSVDASITDCAIQVRGIELNDDRTTDQQDYQRRDPHPHLPH